MVSQAPSASLPDVPRVRAPRSVAALAFVAAAPSLLCGFTGNVGAEAVAYAGVGIGTAQSIDDADSFGEVGGHFRYKFRNFPYDDLSGWLQVGASWTTYPSGGDLGNQLLTIQYLGGMRRNWGEVGGGLAIFGDVSGIGPMLVLPCIRIRVGEADRVQFGFGMVDEAPVWTSGGLMHWEGIFAVPFKKVWAPRLKIGARLNPYSPIERFPLELWGGVEARLGRHVRVAVDASLGDGGGTANPPSFTALLKVGMAAGPGTKSDRKPKPAD